MDALARIVFHMDASDSDALGRSVHRNVDPAVLGQRLLVLGDLVALGQIGIKVILAGKAGNRADATVERQRGLNRQFDGSRVQHRQGARQTQADRTNIAVWFRAETGGAAAKNLRRGGQLHVYFEADHRFVFGDQLGAREMHERR